MTHTTDFEQRAGEQRLDGAQDSTAPAEGQDEAVFGQEDAAQQGHPDVHLLQYSADDFGNAQAVQSLYYDQFLFCEELRWLYYTGTHWKRQEAEATLDLKIAQTLKRRKNVAEWAMNEVQKVLETCKDLEQQQQYKQQLAAYTAIVKVSKRQAPIISVLPTSVRETRFSLAYSHPSRNPMTGRPS